MAGRADPTPRERALWVAGALLLLASLVAGIAVFERGGNGYIARDSADVPLQ